MQAALVAAGLLVSALVLPPVVLNSGAGALFLLALLLAVALLVSAASVALVWLRKSTAEAAASLAIAMLGAAILSWLTLGSALPALWLGTGMWLPMVPLAWVLRHTVRMEMSILTAALMGAAMVLATHVALGDAAMFWLERLRAMFADAGGAAAMTEQQIEEVLVQVAGMMTGILIASLLMNALSSLFLARWWQAKLFNPGGFRTEFHGLRLGRQACMLLAVVLLVGLFTQVQILNSLAVVAMFIAMLQGLAVAHGTVAKRAMGSGWLIGLYVLMGLVPHTALILAVLGIADSWVDFRERATRASS